MDFRQHEESYSMSEKEILQDIVAYCPAVAGVTGAMPAKDVQRLIGNYLHGRKFSGLFLNSRF